MEAKKHKEQVKQPKFIAVDEEDCVGFGETLIQAADNLLNDTGTDLRKFRYFKLTEVKVDLVEVQVLEW